MTGEEIKALTGSMDRLTEALVANQTMAGKINDLAVGQAQIGATLSALADTEKAQVSALFDYRQAHEDRLTNIEKTYVDRADWQRSLDQNRQDHERYTSEISRLTTRMAYIGGAIALGTAILNWVASNWHLAHAAVGAAGAHT